MPIDFDINGVRCLHGMDNPASSFQGFHSIYPRFNPFDKSKVTEDMLADNGATHVTVARKVGKFDRPNEPVNLEHDTSATLYGTRNDAVHKAC